MTRPHARYRTIEAGCSVCHGGVAHWTGANAQGVAARHHDATGHETWCEVRLSVRYGTAAADPRQVDLEDAIASASSGDALKAVPLTELDVSADALADVSKPVGRSSSTTLAAAKPEHARV